MAIRSTIIFLHRHLSLSKQYHAHGLCGLVVSPHMLMQAVCSCRVVRRVKLCILRSHAQICLRCPNQTGCSSVNTPAQAAHMQLHGILHIHADCNSQCGDTDFGGSDLSRLREREREFNTCYEYKIANIFLAPG